MEHQVSAAPTAPDTGGGDLPDELLNQPVMQALMAGNPAAASTTIKTFEDTPLGKLMASNVEPLKQAGFGFYRSQDGQLGVVFNQLRINPQEIVQADQKGGLLEVAPPVEQIEQAIMSDPAANPVISANDPSGAAQLPPPVAGGGVETQVMGGGGGGRPPTGPTPTERQLGSPTSGPKPGAGRVVNTLLKQVV